MFHTGQTFKKHTEIFINVCNASPTIEPSRERQNKHRVVPDGNRQLLLQTNVKH